LLDELISVEETGGDIMAIHKETLPNIQTPIEQARTAIGMYYEYPQYTNHFGEEPCPGIKERRIVKRGLFSPASFVVSQSLLRKCEL
jgi:hypothetical protein